MAENKIDSVYPREAATLALETKVLQLKQKGDHITAREVLEATGSPVDSWRSKIKTWARRRALVLRPVPNDGYRICLDSEHADYSRVKSKTLAKSAKEALRALVVTDQSKLDSAQIRRHEFMMPRVAALAARAEQDVKEIKSEFKLSERVPMRALKGV